MLGKVWSVISGEWIVAGLRKANSGGVVIARSLYCSIIIYAFILALTQAVDPNRVMEFNLQELRLAVRDSISWLGAIFAAVYASLYTRFAGQYRYLADLYNQIKSKEIDVAAIEQDDQRHAARIQLAAWKAGFMEDAQELHLARKPLFASVIRAWSDDDAVRSAFVKHAAGGEKGYSELVDEALRAFERRQQVHAGRTAPSQPEPSKPRILPESRSAPMADSKPKPKT